MNIKSPDIYFFNPTCEYAVANGNASWQPNRLLQKMESDLAILPLFLAQPNDCVLADSELSSTFFLKMSDLNVQLPRVVAKDKALKDANFLNIPKGKLLPWGWSPAAHKLLDPLKKNCSNEFLQLPVSTWKPEYKTLYSKKFALGILKEISAQIDPEILIPSELLPKICTTKREIELLIKKWNKLLIKAPWSSSGRGLQPITKTPVHPKVWEKLMGIVNNQGFVMVEPLLNKVMDLALQFELKNQKVSFLGISRFSVDSKGQYQGNFLNGFPENTDTEIKNFADSIPEKILLPLISAIEKSNLAMWYEGNFGIDTLIFLDKNNRLKINPCLEINVRQNMGLLSLYFEKLLLPGEKGIFRTFYQPGKTFFIFKNEMEKKYPLKLSKNKIKSGFISLIDTDPNTHFGAYILVQ